MAFSIVIKVEGDEMVARGIRSMGDRFQKTRGGRDISAVGRDRGARAKIRAALTSHIVP
jgi:hypothetical protein